MKAIHCTGRITMLRTLLRSRSAPKSLKIPRSSSSVTIPFTFARGRLCNTSEVFGAACVSLCFPTTPRYARGPGAASQPPRQALTPALPSTHWSRWLAFLRPHHSLRSDHSLRCDTHTSLHISTSPFPHLRIQHGGVNLPLTNTILGAML